MKHVWTCIKKPYLDKVVKQKDKAFVDDSGANNAMFHLISVERVEMIPGWYVCDTCEAFIQSNYAPPEDWKNAKVIPDCSEEIMRKIHGS